MKALGAVLAVSLVVAGCTSLAASPSPSAVPRPSTTRRPSSGPTIAPTPDAGEPSLTQLVGQKLVVAMEGASASADLLARIGRGEVGGVVLFGDDITTPAALVALTRQLRDAATKGGQPPLLIAVDQEGGDEKRIPWAPPTLSPLQMGRDGRVSVARAQGASTGEALRALGIDVDFAPVADVPASSASFMAKAHRTFSSDAATTAALADAFANGLESAGVMPAMKHFPGIGFATRNTDADVVTIDATTASLDPGLLPYRTAIDHDIPLIMLSNATYTAYDPDDAAGWSPAIGIDLLRGDLGFEGVTITDSLDGAAHARALSTRVLAEWAAEAGTDMILATGSEATTRGIFATLLADATDGTIPMATLRASYDRIVALKADL